MPSSRLGLSAVLPPARDPSWGQTQEIRYRKPNRHADAD